MRYLFLLILLVLAVNLKAQSEQQAESWLGLNNLFFKHQDIVTDRLLVPGDSSTFLYKELVDHQFSFGLSFRKFNDDGIRYQQFDLGIDKSRKRSFTIVNRPAFSISEPQASSLEVTNFQVFAGYQRGRLLPIIRGLSGDVGGRAYLWYNKNQQIPLSSIAFPRRTTSLGSGFNLRTGLVYRIHKRLNIGYYLAPITVKWSWENRYWENPVLAENQRKSQGYAFDVVLFESAINFRNFHINYIL